jgi:polygalacturonase
MQKVIVILLLPYLVGATRVFDVTKYGAKGDGVSYDTAAVRGATTALKAAGGGTLLFPAPGTFLTGAFNISSNIMVEIELGATVLGSTRGEDWPLLVANQVWPQFGHGSDCVPGSESCRLMHQSLLFGWNATNVTISGGGTFDCNSQKDTWWHCAKNLSMPPCSGYGRPHCFMLSNTTDVEVSHINVTNSPDWTLHFSRYAKQQACSPLFF